MSCPTSSLLKPEERVLPTLEADGSRRWLHPRLAKGKFWNARRLTAYGLIAFFTVLPFVKIEGKPAVLLDLTTRHFTLFGYTFLPQDTYLLALLMLAGLLGIFLFTAVLGRVWCGWGCPQTVYMEFVYRPIERLFLGKAGVGGRPAKGQSPWRYGLMYGAFFLVSLHIGNTFLAYFVGVEQIQIWTTRSPLDHPTGFLIVLAVTLGMMLDFAFFREQVCSVMCPYARFQSVLLDRNSLVVRYDLARGEPRGKGKVKGSELSVERVHNGVALPVLPTPDSQLPTRAKGDCVDCTMCVQVCPTGIDIRDGVQLECINCAQCIDACDTVMAKVGKPAGLIRYASQNAMENKPTRLVRPRTVIYSVVITLVMSLLVFLFATKAPADVLLVRNQGMPFVSAPDGRVQNTLRVQLTNRTDAPMALAVSVADAPDVEILNADIATVTLGPTESTQKPLHLLAPASAFKDGKRVIVIRIITPDGQTIDRKCQLFGPG